VGLGLDPGVVVAARSAGSPARRELESLLGEAAAARAAAEDERVAAHAARQEAERVRRAAEDERAELQRRLERSRADAAAAKEAARADMERELAAATRELAELRREIAAARREEAARRRGIGDDARARERDRRLGEASRRASAARHALDEAPQAVVAVPEGPPPEVGEAVIDSLTGLRGTVVAIRGGRAEVQGDTARMRVPLERLARDAAAVRRTARRPAPEPVAPAGPPVAMDVDVRGQRAEATRDEVRRRVDAAAVAGVDLLRVIHGHGTGALRAVVREELGHHPLVASVEPAPPEEGGDGATLVHIGR
jgi:DNA mismatch repair protein MutS2